MNWKIAIVTVSASVLACPLSGFAQGRQQYDIVGPGILAPGVGDGPTLRAPERPRASQPSPAPIRQAPRVQAPVRPTPIERPRVTRTPSSLPVPEASLPVTPASPTQNDYQDAPVDSGASSQQDGIEVVGLDHCLVSVIDVVEVPAEVGGVIEKIAVRPGAVLRSSDLIAQLDQRRIRLQREMAFLKSQQAKAVADNDVNVRDAKSAAGAAKEALDAAKQASERSPGAVSVAEMRRLQSESDRATFAVERASQEHMLAQLTYRNATAELKTYDLELAMREIRVAQGGVVVDVYKHAGEWVAPGEAVAKVVGLSRLLIEGYVDASRVGPHQVSGRPVLVTATLDNNRVETFTGRIVFVNPTVESHGKYRVWAEVQNRQDAANWLLRPGLIVSMSIRDRHASQPIARQPNSQQASWHVHSRGRAWGPFPITKVQQAIARGEINGRTLVWSKGMRTWRNAAQIAEFQIPLRVSSRAATTFRHVSRPPTRTVIPRANGPRPAHQSPNRFASQTPRWYY